MPIVELPGPVEIDETFVGRRRNAPYVGFERPPGAHLIIFGIFCRTSGRFIAYCCDNKSKSSLYPHIYDHVNEVNLKYIIKYIKLKI